VPRAISCNERPLGGAAVEWLTDEKTFAYAQR
jgi:hypothetical protein